MKYAGKKIFFLILVFSLVVSITITGGAGATKIKEISSPGFISKPGYYQLSTDLPSINTSLASVSRGSSDWCTFFSITSSDVIFDGMGHTLDAGSMRPQCDSVCGFSIRDTGGDKPGRLHITIRNITLLNFNSAISATSVGFFNLEDVHVKNCKDGIRLATSKNVIIINNSFSEAGGFGIFGGDNANVTIENNNLSNTVDNGIRLDGGQMVWLIPSSIFSIRVPAPIELAGFTVKRKTSGSGYTITHNTVQNASSHGIYLNLIDDFTVTDNIVMNCSHDGLLCDNCGPKRLVANNTLIGNGQNDPDYLSGHYYLPWSAILGMIILLLFSAVPNIGQRGGVNIILAKLWEKYQSLENWIRAFFRTRRVPTELEILVVITLIGAFIFGTVFAFRNMIDFDWSSYLIYLMMSGTVIVTPRAVQYLIGLKKSLDADYRLWGAGISVILITYLLPFPGIFGTPVKMTIPDEEKQNKREVFIIKIAAPLTTILLGIAFAIVYWYDFFPQYSLNGLQLCFLASVVMLLPVSPMEGQVIWRERRIVWIVLFFPVLATYLISLLLQYTFLSAIF